MPEVNPEPSPEPNVPAEAGRPGETPEQTIAALREALSKANSEAKENRLKAVELDKIKAAQMSDLEKAQAEAAELRDRLGRAEADRLRQRVALTKGLPSELVDRLKGETEDELSADADALLALVNAPRELIPDPTQGPQGSAPSTPEQEFMAFASRL